MTCIKDIYNYINSFAPYDTQEDWDNSGLLIGDFDKEVKKCVMALDATKSVCRFARDEHADLVITHHPVIFKGIKSLSTDSAVYILANSSIGALCAHTNFDYSKDGINFNLAKILGLKNVKRLDDTLIVTGELEKAVHIYDFASFVKDKLCVSGIRYTDSSRPIKTVAIGGGACEEYIPLAYVAADCFVSGDIKYHAMLEASENDFSVISAGHFETENAAFLMLKNRLEKEFKEVEFIPAPVSNSIKTV